MSDITKEEAIEHLKNMEMPHDNYYEELDDFITQGNAALKMAIEALENQKTGHWIDNKVQTKLCNCSECYALSKVYSRYCPNCGAKMEGK